MGSVPSTTPVCRRSRAAAAIGLLTLASACTPSAAPGSTSAIAPAATASEPSPKTPQRAATVYTSVPPPALVDAFDGPTLFLGTEPDAPAIGYVAEGVQVEPSEVPSGDRVLVRIDGPLRVRAHAPLAALFQKVQRRGGIRGAPLYVGPGDHVQVLGPDAEEGRMQVVVRARVGSAWSDAYAGSFPAIGLGLEDPPDDADLPRAGEPHVLSPGTSLTLYDAPNGSAVAGLPPQPVPVSIEVLQKAGEYRAVRVGRGPYLIGYTRDAIEPGEATTPPATDASAPAASGDVPARIEREQGELVRVAQGAKLRFNGSIVAVFKEEGWARVLTRYEGGQTDVFAAVDDDVAVRGLVDDALLSEP